MRILIVTNGLPPAARGGAEAYADLTARGLAERHHVEILSGPHGDEVRPYAVRDLAVLASHEDGPGWRKAAWHLRDQWRSGVHVALVRHIRRMRPEVVLTHNVVEGTRGTGARTARCPS